MLPWNLSLTSNSLKDERSNIECTVTKKYFKIDDDIIDRVSVMPWIASLKIVRRQSRLSSSNALFFISTINAFLELKHTSVFLTNDFFEIGPSLHDNKGVNGRFKGALLLCLIET